LHQIFLEKKQNQMIYDLNKIDAHEIEALFRKGAYMLAPRRGDLIGIELYGQSFNCQPLRITVIDQFGSILKLIATKI